jgi:hypothetical protein
MRIIEKHKIICKYGPNNKLGPFVRMNIGFICSGQCNSRAILRKKTSCSSSVSVIHLCQVAQYQGL